MIQPSSQSWCWGLRLLRDIEENAQANEAIANTSGNLDQSIGEALLLTKIAQLQSSSGIAAAFEMAESC
jgi:hypothetical protein